MLRAKIASARLVVDCLEVDPTHHRVTLPNNNVLGSLDRFDMGRQELFNFVSSVPADQRDLARNVVRVDD